MEYYDVFNEMQNVQDKKTIIIVEDDNKYINLKNMLVELGIKCISGKQQLINIINSDYRLCQQSVRTFYMFYFFTWRCLKWGIYSK